MNQDVLAIIISGLSIIITGLCSWATAAFINFLNSKIADKKLVTFLSDTTMIVTDAVQCVYQTFVETLKEHGKFDEEMQREAKQRALDIIESQLTNEMRNYIEDHFGDIELWLSEKIESVIYSMKR